MESSPLKLLMPHCNCDRLLNVPENHWPCVLAVQVVDDDAAILRLNISSQLLWFNGHFPDQPVLPGVVQTHWAGSLACTIFDLSNDFSAMTKIKFKTPVLPGQTLCLELGHVSSRQQITYRYHEEGVDFSTGTMNFGGPVT